MYLQQKIPSNISDRFSNSSLAGFPAPLSVVTYVQIISLSAIMWFFSVCCILGVMQWLSLLSLVLVLNETGAKICLATLIGSREGVYRSRVAQRKRAGLITQRSVDRSHPLLFSFALKVEQLDNNRGTFVTLKWNLQTGIYIAFTFPEKFDLQ